MVRPAAAARAGGALWCMENTMLCVGNANHIVYTVLSTFINNLQERDVVLSEHVYVQFNTPI